MTDDATYFLDRSEQEAIRAIQSPVPTVAAIHQELCLLYTARALVSMARGGRD